MFRTSQIRGAEFGSTLETLHAIRNAVLQPFRKVEQRWRVHRNRRFLSRRVRGDEPVRPVFIVGPPRCGSTLLYQSLVHYFNFCYFSNQMMDHPFDVPMFVEREDVRLDYQSDFSSHYGLADEPSAPHESWPFWRRFYPHAQHDYVPAQLLSPVERNEIWRTLAFLVRHYSRPFICKNIEIALRLKSLREFLGSAVFIVVKRDPRATVSSILRGREEHMGNRATWMGAKPLNFFELKKRPVIYQIAGQISAIYGHFYSDVQRMPYMEVWYEEFCDHPAETLEELGHFLYREGVPVSRTNRSMPEFFRYRNGTLLNEIELSIVEGIFAGSDFFKTFSIR